MIYYNHSKKKETISCRVVISVTLSERTQHQIEQMILNKEYNADNYLPSEGELCKKFSVSRVTVRDAVRSLETRGFLKRIHGKGLLVLDNSMHVLSRSITDVINRGDCSLENLMEVRTFMEQACAELAAQRATEEDLEILDQSCKNMENASEMDNAYFANDQLFHVQLAKASKNPLLAIIVDAYTPLLRDSILLASRVDYCIEKRHHYHRDIYNCILHHDSQGAVAAMQHHLQATEKNQGRG